MNRTSPMDHPPTDEMCEQITDTIWHAAADWQLEQVIKWLNFDYQTDPNLSRERKQRGGFKEIAIALEKAMRPQENNL